MAFSAGQPHARIPLAHNKQQKCLKENAEFREHPHRRSDADVQPFPSLMQSRPVDDGGERYLPEQNASRGTDSSQCCREQLRKREGQISGCNLEQMLCLVSR